MTTDDYKWEKAIKIQGKERFKCFSKDDSDFFYIFQRKDRKRNNYYCYFCYQIKKLIENDKLEGDTHLVRELPYITIDVDFTIVLKKDTNSIDDGHFCKYFINKGKGYILSNGKRIIPGNIEKNYGKVSYTTDAKNIITISKVHNVEISWQYYRSGYNHQLFHCILCKEINTQFEKDSKRPIPYIKIVNDYIMGFDPDFPVYDHFCLDAQVNASRKIAEKIPGKKQYRTPSVKTRGYYVFDFHRGSTYHCSDCYKIYKHGIKDKDEKSYKLKYINIDENGIIDGNVDEGHICGDIDTNYIEINSKRYVRNAKNEDFGQAFFPNNSTTKVITTSKIFDGKQFLWSSYKKTTKYTLFKCVGCKKLKKNKVSFIKVIDGKLMKYNPDFPKYDHVCISNKLDETVDLDVKRKRRYYNSCKSMGCKSPKHMTVKTRQNATTDIKKSRKRIKKEVNESGETKKQMRIEKTKVQCFDTDIAQHSMVKENLLSHTEENLKSLADDLTELEGKTSEF